MSYPPRRANACAVPPAETGRGNMPRCTASALQNSARKKSTRREANNHQYPRHICNMLCKTLAGKDDPDAPWHPWLALKPRSSLVPGHLESSTISSARMPPCSRRWSPGSIPSPAEHSCRTVAPPPQLINMHTPPQCRLVVMPRDHVACARLAMVPLTLSPAPPLCGRDGSGARERRSAGRGTEADRV